MSSRSINRKDFLIVTVSAVGASVLAAGCGDDPVTPSGTAGTGTGGSGTAGTGTAGTGTAGTTAGTGTSGSTSGGTSAGTGGSSAGTGGSAAGSGGSGGAGGAGGSGGSGGSGGTGGSGGSGGGGGTGGGGGGMCGTASIMQTSNEPHDHIPSDPATLKADLKALINGATATMEFTVPSDTGQNGAHVHKIKLSAQQVAMLKGGGMVTGVVTFDTTQGEGTHATGHTHTYTISCAN